MSNSMLKSLFIHPKKKEALKLPEGCSELVAPHDL